MGKQKLRKPQYPISNKNLDDDLRVQYVPAADGMGLEFRITFIMKKVGQKDVTYSTEWAIESE